MAEVKVGEVLEQENPYSIVKERGRVRNGSALFSRAPIKVGSKKTVRSHFSLK
jgi:hypothetical protein